MFICLYLPPYISLLRINRGVKKAYSLAMNDFTNTSLASSCIIFTELLSQDSTRLRVHLSTARRLLKYCDKFFNDAVSICKLVDHVICLPYMVLYSSSVSWDEIKSFMCSGSVDATGGCYGHTSGYNGDWTVSDIMLYELYGFLYSCSVETLECWQLIGSFCQLHGLVASKRFLITCAEQGKWLPMLCHAQQLHLPPDEVW